MKEGHISWARIRGFRDEWFKRHGLIWAPIASWNVFLGPLEPEPIWYMVIVLLASTWAFWEVWPTKRVDLEVPGSDSVFEVRFGDVFKEKGVIVIPVNEYFDGELGDHVSEESLHGQFIKNILGGQAETFNSLTSKALKEVPPEESNVARSTGRRDRYAIGTVASIDVNKQRYLLVALSHTNLRSLKAVATLEDLWMCLAGLWKGICEHSSGQPVRMPLVGSGLSGTGLPPSDLLEIIRISFLDYTKRRKVADRVAVVLPHRFAGSLDLNDVKRSWS